MTLSDIANHICVAINQQQPEDVSACKAFVMRGFSIIWQMALWKDSLYDYVFTIPSTAYAVTDTWLPTKGIHLTPTLFSHVSAVRTGTFHLNIESSETPYRSDWDEFASTGRAEKYRLLAPAVWELDTAQALYRENPTASDASSPVTVDVANVSVLSRLTANELSTEDRIDTISKIVTNGVVNVGTRASGFTITQLGNFGLSWGINQSNNPTTPDINQGQSSTIVVHVGDVIYFWFDQVSPGTSYTVVDVNATLLVTEINDPSGITVTRIATNLITLQTTDTIAPKRQRIQLLGALTAGTQLRVLGKIKAPNFTADGDEPPLTGCTDALIAFGHSWMLRRARQYSKARDIMSNDFLPLLEQLKAEQTVQQAHNKRFIPEDGYGDDFGFSSAVFGATKDS